MALVDNDIQHSSSPPLLQTDELELPLLSNNYKPFQLSILETSSSRSSPIQSSPCRAYPDKNTPTISRNRTSWVYKHMPDADINIQYFSSTNKLEWRFKYCTTKYLLNGGTRLIKAHLEVSHTISELSLRQDRSRKRQMSIEDSLITATANPQKRRCFKGSFEGGFGSSPGSDYIAQSDVNPDQLEVLITTFITECNLPLRLVECSSFRNLLVYLNHQIEPWLPEDHHTIRTWIQRQFDFNKQQIKDQLRTALSYIHISTDLWTSGNNLALLGAIARFVNSQGDLEEVLICLKEVEGSHTGENLSQYILQAIDDFEITPRLGYFQMDNAPNNDVMLREVSIGLELFLLIGSYLTLCSNATRVPAPPSSHPLSRSHPKPCNRCLSLYYRSCPC